MDTFEKARGSIRRNARSIDLAVFKHRFENAPAEDIIEALGAYQNPDGGFGGLYRKICRKGQRYL